jgi:hypothetical protein
MAREVERARATRKPEWPYCFHKEARTGRNVGANRQPSKSALDDLPAHLAAEPHVEKNRDAQSAAKSSSPNNQTESNQKNAAGLTRNGQSRTRCFPSVVARRLGR